MPLNILLPPHDAVQPQPFSLLQNENNTTFHQQPAIQLIFFQCDICSTKHMVTVYYYMEC